MLRGNGYAGFTGSSNGRAVHCFHMIPSSRRLIYGLERCYLGPLSYLYGQSRYQFPILLIRPVQALRSCIYNFRRIGLCIDSGVPFIAVSTAIIVDVFCVLRVVRIDCAYL